MTTLICHSVPECRVVAVLTLDDCFSSPDKTLPSIQDHMNTRDKTLKKTDRLEASERVVNLMQANVCKAILSKSYFFSSILCRTDKFV